MTLAEFLEKLGKTPRRWYVESDGKLRIRLGMVWCCPITSLTGEAVSESTRAAPRLGLKRELEIAIVNAADERRGYDPELRVQLLKACGLGAQR